MRMHLGETVVPVTAQGVFCVRLRALLRIWVAPQVVPVPFLWDGIFCLSGLTVVLLYLLL